MTSTALQQPRELRTTRQLIWLYFWLLIFEGALRKWIVPSLSNVLLIIRDPVVIAIYAAAAQARVFPKTNFINVIIGLGAFSFVASLVVIPTYIMVSLYGLRASFLHLPLVFVIPRVFTLSDLRKLGFWLLVIAVPMAFLVLVQFRSDGSARVNTGVGEGGLQIVTDGGKIRPAGTFSYSSGVCSFVTIVGSYLFYSCFRKKTYPIWLVLPAAGALFLMVMCSGSRASLSAISILIIAAAAISLYSPKFFAGSAKALVTIVIVYIVVGSVAEVKEGSDILDSRISGNGGVKEGLVDRFISELLPINGLMNAPILGNGLGMGTNAAAKILTGSMGFMLAENDWDRVILESGPFLGLAYVILRIAIVLHAGGGIFAPVKRGDPLSALLFAAGGITFLNGQFAQPMTLGFAVFTMGICLAAANPEELVELNSPEPVLALPQGPPVVRSRSVFSEDLYRER
jgi:hypothetical protein